METKISKSQVMVMAHSIAKYFHASLSEALRKAWKACKLILSLRLGKVEFSYIKNDGSVRKAIGTLSRNLYTYTPSGKSGRTWVMPAYIVRYFDLEKNAFRSFNAFTLI